MPGQAFIDEDYTPIPDDFYADCQDPRCSRINGKCVGWHCSRCGEPCSSQGHFGMCKPEQVTAHERALEAMRAIERARLVPTARELLADDSPEIDGLVMADRLARLEALAAEMRNGDREDHIVRGEN